VAFNNLRRFDEAIADLERPLVLAPQRARYISNLGAVHAIRGRLQDAIEQCERGIEIAPRRAFGLSVLVGYYLQVGRFEDAIEAMLERSPGWKKKASSWAHAVARMKASAPKWPVLIRLREEAASVLGEQS
jgi:tetratricopeptide (TPR) repeat protein